jgi:CheY-like chemotaxis protein
MQHQQHPSTTIAILDSNKVVSNALSLLLKGLGYDTKLIEAGPAGLADGLLDGVNILLLAPGLSTGVRDALLSVVRDNLKTAQMPVITLSATAGEALDDESGALLVPWPSPVTMLAQQIETILSTAMSEEG